MKTLIAAVALTIAFPAAAQQAAHQQHAQHAQHGGMDHSQHQGMDHGKEEKDCCKMKCCEKARKAGKKMECCDEAKGEHGGMKH